MWLSALAFLAAAGFVLLATTLAVFGAVRHKHTLAKYTALAAAAGAGLYAAVLLGAGVASPARELANGEEKHICEIDCHLAYTVTGTARPQPTRFDVTMRVRFDAETISSQRGDGELYAGDRRIVLLDTDGEEYQPSQTSGLNTPLRPGQSTQAQLMFDIPASAKPALLRFEDADPLKRLLIGSETAPLHKRTLFRLS